MRRKIKFHPEALHHIYTISEDRGVIFYSIYDYVVFFTIMSVCARRYAVVIEEACIMRNHIHLGVLVRDQQKLSRFMMTLLSSFVKEYDSRGGAVRLRFKSGYGRADKLSEKDRRSCLVYILNNGVEKKACSSALDYRWNFLRYSDSRNPYSIPLVQRRLSSRMKLCMSIVDTAFRMGSHLRYSFFESNFKHLDKTERNQLLDYIISKYNVINYRSMQSHFTDAQAMNAVLDAAKGSDYDINEDYSYEDYRHYDMMTSIAEKRGFLGASGQLIYTEFPSSLAKEFLYETGASDTEISRFLHCFQKHQIL